LLRLPAGASAVRCPNCKTVLAVEPAEPAAAAPAPVAAPPLPFGRPAATAAPATPVAQAAPPRAAPARRAKLAPEDPYSSPAHADDTQPDPEARRRQMRRELEKLEDEKEREEDRLDELAVRCKNGRTALQLLLWGVRLYALAILFQLVALAAAGFDMGAYAGLMGLGSLVWAGLTTVLFAAGMGFAIAGPVEGRHIGIMGLVISLLHALGGLLQPANLAIMAGIQGLDNNDRALWSNFLVVQDFLGLATDLPLLADHPARFVHSYNWSLPGLVVAALEFTRLVLVCLLTQVYAAGGKDPETGHRAFQTVSRMFWIVLLTASFRLAASSALDGLNPDDVMFKIGVGVQSSITAGCYLGLMLSLFLQSQVMSDTVDLVDYRRFADKAERLEL
jgi:LSD1 subclass zinc finger protein